MEFYEDIEKIRGINKVLSDRSFFIDRGYDYDNIPRDLRELSLPIRSPLTLLKGFYRNILDIGCGAGLDIYLLSKKFDGSRIIGIDVSYPLLYEGKKIHKLSVLNSNAIHLSFKDKVFDLVLLNGSFNQMEDKELLMKEIKRVLTPEGYVVISDLYKKHRVNNLEEGLMFNINGAMTLGELYLFFKEEGFSYLDGIFEKDYTREVGIFSILWKAL